VPALTVDSSVVHAKSAKGREGREVQQKRKMLLLFFAYLRGLRVNLQSICPSEP
jgi:hypothetical protein